MKLEDYIRTEAGIGLIRREHIVGLILVTVSAFESTDAVVVVYKENDKDIIFCMPTSNVNSENRLLSEPVEKEMFQKHKKRAQEWLKIFARKDDIFREIYLNYEVKFVREFPKKVLKAKDGH